MTKFDQLDEMRKSQEFNATPNLKNYISPQTALGIFAQTRKSGGLVSAKSTQELNSSYQTSNLRRKAQ